MNSYKHTITILLIAFSIVFLYKAVYAESFVGEINTQNNAFAGEGGAQFTDGTYTVEDPRTIVARIISIALGLLGTAFIIYTIYAGYMIMTAAGDEDKIKKGKSTLFTGIIGVLIIMLAYAITLFVTNTFIYANQQRNGLFIRGGLEFGSPGRAPGTSPDITNTSPIGGEIGTRRGF